ncbi:MAG: hypothetical protein ACFB03_17255 [Paracoccaceae bacterium]
MFFVSVALAACASDGGGSDLAIADRTYELNFERDGCGVLKTGDGAYYEWDADCSGGTPDYSQSNIQRLGNRFFIEAASLYAEKLTENGFTGTFSLRGRSQKVTATLR